MNTKKMDVDHLLENIVMLRDLAMEAQELGRRAFHKAGHVIMYYHLNMPHGCVSIEGHDSIEDNLSFISLHNTNDQEVYLQIALGGVVMEQLIANAGASTDEDIEKAVLLIRIHNRMSQKMTTEEDDLLFLIATNHVGAILLQYQREAGLLYRELIKKRTLGYVEICTLFDRQSTPL
jgi:hypothetical protein